MSALVAAQYPMVQDASGEVMPAVLWLRSSHALCPATAFPPVALAGSIHPGPQELTAGLCAVQQRQADLHSCIWLPAGACTGLCVAARTLREQAGLSSGWCAQGSIYWRLGEQRCVYLLCLCSTAWLACTGQCAAVIAAMRG